MTDEPIVIGTFTGRLIDLQRITSDDIRLADIAHALALTCRFGGHCSIFYSVAEHSIRMSNLSNLFPFPAEILMHDAAEAYVGDFNPGMKHAFSLRPFEEKIQDVIAERFDLWSAGLRHPDLKVLDEMMSRTEIRDLLNWPQSESYYLKITTENEPLAEIIEPWTWEQAEMTFLARAAGLGIKD